MSKANIDIKWFLKPVPVIISILFMGPFALGFVWMSPAFKKVHKVILTVLTIAFTILLVRAGYRLYNIILEEARQLKEVLSQ